MGQHPPPQVIGLADIERQAILAIEEIDAMAMRQLVQTLRIEVLRQAGGGRQCPDDALDLPGFMACVQGLPELPDEPGIA